MSFNISTKLNNLYQIVSPIIDIQDVSGSLLPDVSNNYNYSNNLTLQGLAFTYDTIDLGTITKPVNFTTSLPTNFYIRITGEANPGSLGYMEGGAWIKDVNGNTIAQLNIGNDRGVSSGLFDLSNNTVVANLSPSQFPLSVQEYVYYLGWVIYGNSTTFTCNVVMTPDYPNYSQAYYSPILNKFGYVPITPIPPTPSSSTGYAVLREIQPAGTNSTVSFPNTTSNVRTLRQINNIQFDNLGITISGSPNWTITIPTAGTYAFSGRAMFNITKVGVTPYIIAVNSKVFISDGTNENFIVGDSMTWRLDTSGTDSFNVNVDLTAVASLSGATTISFKQVCNPVFTGATQALTGGRAVNILSAPEVYATLQITKLSA